MELEKHVINKAFYGERKDVVFYLPKGLEFVRFHPHSLHYDGQVDMVSIMECSEEDQKKIREKNKWVNVYRIGKYVILTMDSLNDTKVVPECTLEKLNDKYDLTEYFIMEFDNKYRPLFISKIKGVTNSEKLLVDTVYIEMPFSNAKNKMIEIDGSLSFDSLSKYGRHSEYLIDKILNNDKAKTIFHTLISRYLKDTGIDWKNGFVDDNLDMDYTKNLYNTYEDICVGEIWENNDDDEINKVLKLIQKNCQILKDINTWLNV